MQAASLFYLRRLPSLHARKPGSTNVCEDACQMTLCNEFIIRSRLVPQKQIIEKCMTMPMIAFDWYHIGVINWSSWGVKGKHHRGVKTGRPIVCMISSGPYKIKWLASFDSSSRRLKNGPSREEVCWGEIFEQPQQFYNIPVVSLRSAGSLPASQFCESVPGLGSWICVKNQHPPFAYWWIISCWLSEQPCQDHSNTHLHDGVESWQSWCSSTSAITQTILNNHQSQHQRYE